MKKIFFSILLILIVSCGKKDEKNSSEVKNIPQQQKKISSIADTNFLLRKDFAGRVRLGAFTDTLPKIFPASQIRRTVIQQEGMKEYIVEVGDTSSGKILLHINQDCTRRCRMVRIAILDPRYKTIDSVGIGSTFAELRKRYKIAWTDLAEGNAVARVDELGMSFMMPPAAYPPNIHRKKVVPIADTAHILKIILSE